MTITPEEIARLRALEAKATPGPWERASLGPARNIPAVIQREDDDWVPVAYFSDERGDGLAAEPEHDGNFIVTARNAMPMLLDEIERLRADLREAVALLCEAENYGMRFSDENAMGWLDRRDALLAKHKEEA